MAVNLLKLTVLMAATSHPSVCRANVTILLPTYLFRREKNETINIGAPLSKEECVSSPLWVEDSERIIETYP